MEFKDKSVGRRQVYQLPTLLALSLLVLSQASYGAPGPAGSAAKPGAAAPISDAQLAKQLSLLENRFFYHLYYQDPAEKRLERLELLVFGEMQAGANGERLQKLNQALAQRPSLKGEANADGSVNQSPNSAESKEAAVPPVKDSSQYPILKTLEWKILKKTYLDDSLDQRLDRLETKVFGQPAQAMAYFDRVERLKRTVGVGLAEMPHGTTRLGPAPKAQPREQSPGSIPDFNGFTMPFPSRDFYNRGTAPMPRGFGDFSQMFDQLNHQMEEMMRMPPGAYQFDPQTGDWVEPGSGKHIKPNSVTPSPQRLTPKPPPYSDPNSI